MKRNLFILLLIIVSCSSAVATGDQEGREIKVGITSAPPFMIIDNNSVTGVCHDLWKEVADSLNLTYKHVLFSDYNSLLKGLKLGKVDIMINPLSMTDKRLIDYRLSIPFYVSDMGIVTTPTFRIPFLSAFGHLLKWQTVKMTLALLSFVFIFAVLIWLFERRVNTKQFRKGHRGIFDGIWWAFVTMSTVGYGDKVPRSKIGRMLTIFWMLYAVALFFVFTAEVSSELTISKMQSDIHKMEDLRKLKVGTMKESGYASMLQINHVKYKPFTSLADGLDALKGKHIDAFVYDAGTLDYTIAKYKLGKDIVLTRSQIREQYFCLAAHKENTGLIDAVNPVLLNITESAEWINILERYNIKE